MSGPNVPWYILAWLIVGAPLGYALGVLVGLTGKCS